MDRTTRSRRPAVFFVAVLSLALATATAAAVDVRGRLRLPSDYGHRSPEAPAEVLRSRYWDQWNGFLQPRDMSFDAARDLAVVLVGEGEMAEEQPGFRLANGGLYPSTLVVRVGARLEIQNTDPVSHRLFADGFAGFNDTPIAPGRMRPLDVSSAGHWMIADRVYAHVTGHLHAIDDLIARAEVRSDGRYHFRNVEPGTYTLKVFHGERVIHTRADVVVEERELTLEPMRITGAPTNDGDATEDAQ